MLRILGSVPRRASGDQGSMAYGLGLWVSQATVSYSILDSRYYTQNTRHSDNHLRELPILYDRILPQRRISSNILSYTRFFSFRSFSRVSKGIWRDP